MIVRANNDYDDNRGREVRWWSGFTKRNPHTHTLSVPPRKYLITRYIQSQIEFRVI